MTDIVYWNHNRLQGLPELPQSLVAVVSSMAFRKNRIYLFARHFSRILASLQTRYGKSPSMPDPNMLECNLNQWLLAGTEHEYKVRWIAVPGEQGSGETRHFFEKSPLIKWNREGLHVDLRTVDYHSIPSGISTIKQLPRDPQLYPLPADPIDEFILTDRENYLVEGSVSNVFLVIDNQVITPSLDSYGIAGIMREQLLRFLPGQRPVKVQPIPKAFLKLASEVWLCNAVRGAGWVRQIQTKQFENQIFTSCQLQNLG